MHFFYLKKEEAEKAQSKHAYLALRGKIIAPRN